MSYRLSVDSFDSTFAVKADGSGLKNNQGKRFKLFPYNTRSENPTSIDLIIGRYISRLEKKSSKKVEIDDLIEKLKLETTIEPGREELFQQVIKQVFFDKDGRIRPISLKMIAHIPCDDPGTCRIADYLVDVLGDESVLHSILNRASVRLDEQSSVLEKYVASMLESTSVPQDPETHYYRITNAVQRKFESDFEFILGARNRTRDHLAQLLEFYYFTYTAQTIMLLNRFMSGDRERCIPLFFSLNWEKTSLNRPCYTQGWRILQDALNKILAHAVVLEILNQTEEECGQVDYIRLNEYISSSQIEDHRIAEEISVLTDRYRNAISDCEEMTALKKPEVSEGETAAEVSFLFESVKTQFEIVRNAPYNRYSAKFKEFCTSKFLKPRGRSGLILNLSEETLILLTKLSIKDQDKMRLNDVFTEFEARGVFLDYISKEHVMRYYEKLNLIEKKSDSGDAQYVKRIL